MVVNMMETEKQRYLRQQQAKEDQQQLIFVNGSVMSKQYKPTSASKQNNAMCTCPFCLYQETPEKFALNLKHGFSRRLGQCPECKNEALLTTLHRVWKVKEFAYFVYRYSFSGFWNKCMFNRFNVRLKLIGQQDNFWNEYHRLKGDEEAEGYNDEI